MRLLIALIVFSLVFISCLYAQTFDFGEFKLGADQHDDSQNIMPHSITGASTQCGVKLELPGGWQIVKDTPNSLDVQGPDGMFLAIVTNDYGPDFPVGASINAYKNSAEQETQQGKIIKWQERTIDSVLGVERVEAPMPHPDDPRRITWVGYKGTEGINIVASSRSRDFDKYYPILNNLVGSIQW